MELATTTLKVVVCGDMSCGKTSILLRVAEDVFNENEKSTLGVAFHIRTFWGKYKLQMWDTAGQERFHSLVSSYFRGSAVVVFVFDVRSKDSFNSIEAKWLQLCTDKAPSDAVLVLVGNKIDTHPRERQVSRDQAEEYAEKNSMYYAEVSARTGEGVEACFEMLVTMAGKKNAHNYISEQEDPKDKVFIGGESISECIDITRKKRACC